MLLDLLIQERKAPIAESSLSKSRFASIPDCLAARSASKHRHVSEHCVAGDGNAERTDKKRGEGEKKKSVLEDRK